MIRGQVFMHVKAFEQLIKKDKLNCNVKFMIEGEEEVGSDNLEKISFRKTSLSLMLMLF